MKLVIALSLVLSILSLNVNAETSFSREILQSFQHQCSKVVPRSVQSALSNIYGLYDLIKRLKESSTCFGTAQLEQTILNYQRVYSEYVVYQSNRNSKANQENRISELTSLLTTSQSLPVDISYYLQTEIYSAQSELISTEADLNRFSSYTNNTALVAAQLLGSVQGFLLSNSDNANCINNSYAYSNMVSHALLAASAFTAPGTSLALASLGVLTQTISKSIHDAKFNNTLGNLDDITTPLAVSCVSHALTNKFCEAEDSIKLIQTYQDDINQNREPRLPGIELLTKHIDLLDHWLKEVYAGSPITSQGDLVNRIKPIRQASFLKDVEMYIKTYYIIKGAEFQNLIGQDRTNAIAKGISELTTIMYGPTITPSSGPGPSPSQDFENPIFVSKSANLLPYQFLFGKGTIKVPNCNIGQPSEAPCSSFVSYIQDRETPLDIVSWDDSIQAALAVIQEILDQVNIRRAQTISVDTYSTIQRAVVGELGKTNAAQGLSLVIKNADRIRDYIESNNCPTLPNEEVDEFDLCQLIKTGKLTEIRRTKDMAKMVYDLLKEGVNPRSIPDEDFLPEQCLLSEDGALGQALKTQDELEVKSFKITSCISKVLKLAERGNDVFFQKIRNIVKIELLARFENGEFDEEVRNIIISTRIDLVTALKNTYGIGRDQLSFEEVYDGLQASKNLTSSSLKEFFIFFKKGALAALKNKDLSKGELANLCFGVMPSAYWKETHPIFQQAWKVCQKVKRNSHKDGPTIAWKNYFHRYKEGGKYLIRLNSGVTQKKIYCDYRNYKIKNRIIDDYKIKYPKSEI